MDTKIVAVFCLVDDMLKALRHYEDPQCRMSDAEVMTVAVVAALFLGGNFSAARSLLQTEGYMPDMLSKSRFSRRLHRIKPLLLTLFNCLAEHWKATNHELVYAIDSFPLIVCDNYRIPRAKLYKDEAYRGYQASKKRYFYGLKLHLVSTRSGQPVEFFLTPGSVSDTRGLEYFNFDLPEGAEIAGDKAYNHYLIEDQLADAGMRLMPFRKKNSKRPDPPCTHYLKVIYRKMIETTGGLINQLMPKKIHATNALGFELKAVLFVLACSINFLFKVAT
jgi:hypothetical protein